MESKKTVIVNETSSFFGRTGGAYITPARLKQMQKNITDKTSEDYQRLTWEALKKSLNGLINKVNVSNIKFIIPEIFGENLLRGQGLLCRSLMKAQAASQPFTPIFSAIVSVINTKFPMIGELLIMRLLAQFRRSYKRSDKQACLSSTNFIAHLVNQRVADEVIALQILMLLLEKPTDDSVEVAVGFMRQVGAFLLSDSTKACNAIFERFRGILHEGGIDKRTQYMVEVLFQVRKEKFNDNPSIPEGLDIVEESEQITHLIALTDPLDTKESLNVFKNDPKFLENEQQYEYMKREILGEESSEEEGSGSEESSSSDDDEEQLETQRKVQIQDQTNTNLVNLRRAIYLTIMSSLNFEECAHKLMKLEIQPGQEIELANMVIECCSQEKNYVNFYGLLGERFCRVSPDWAASFSAAFEETYKTIHRFETNRLRNIAKFFSHLLASDGLTWEVFALVRLTEADTTSSSRIFCKILFQELVEAMGLPKLGQKLNDKELVVTVETAGGMVTRGVFDGLFPKDNPRNTRFAINYFTSIGMGALTEDLREFIKTAPKPVVQNDSSSSDSGSDSSSSSDSDSDSETDSDSDSEASPRKPVSRRSVSPARRDRRKSPSPEVRQRRRSPPTKVSHRSPSPPRRERRSSAGRRRDDSPEPRRTSRSPERYERRSRRTPSPETRKERSVSRDRHRRKSPVRERRKGRSPSPVSRRRRSPSPEIRKKRSPSPERRRKRSQSPETRRRRSPSPERRRRHSPSPERRKRRSPSPDRRRRRSPSPERRRHRSPVGEKRNGRSPSPNYRNKSRRSPERKRNLRSPERSEDSKKVKVEPYSSVKAESSVKVEPYSSVKAEVKAEPIIKAEPSDPLIKAESHATSAPIPTPFVHPSRLAQIPKDRPNSSRKRH
ncbi:pre-mRNA-splicing factor cwc22 [Globomyces sp. JEL0801]|nr:pre-mRNA-splicing factor cwc22 [Globomyces sp. JEL0801]